MNEITALDTIEIDKALAKVEEFRQVFASPTNAENASLKKQASLDLAKIAKLLNAKREESVKPALDEQRRINGAYKPVIDRLDTVSKALIKQVSDYTREVERLERERKKIELEQATKNLLAGKEVAKIEESKPPEVTISTTTVWAYEIVDQLLIPRQYLEPSDKAISSSIKLGVRSIPGLKIYQEERIMRR